MYELPENTRTRGPSRPKSLSDLLQTSMPKVSDPEPPQLGFAEGAVMQYLTGPPSSGGGFLNADGRVVIDPVVIEIIPHEVVEELEEGPPPPPPVVSSAHCMPPFLALLIMCPLQPQWSLAASIWGARKMDTESKDYYNKKR
jgi:hypothetical protein